MDRAVKNAALLLFAIYVTMYPAHALALDSGNLATMAQNLLTDLGHENGPVVTLFLACCVLMGTFLGIRGIIGLTKRDVPPGGCVVQIMVGACFVSFPRFMSILSATFFNMESNASILSETAGGYMSPLSFPAQMFVNFSIFIIQIVGLFAVFRGLKVIADISMSHQRQPQAMHTAVIFIIAGIVCVNILFALELVANTLGTEGISYYNKLFGHINRI